MTRSEPIGSKLLFETFVNFGSMSQPVAHIQHDLEIFGNLEDEDKLFLEIVSEFQL